MIKKRRCEPRISGGRAPADVINAVNRFKGTKTYREERTLSPLVKVMDTQQDREYKV